MNRLVSLALVLIMLLTLTPAALAAAPYEVATETGVIPVAGWAIPYTYTHPVLAEGETAPAVVMLHGTGSDRAEAGGGYLLCQPELAKAGIASIAIDFVGSGESTGDYRDYTWTSGMDDAVAAMAFLKDQPLVDDARIGIMGWSQGGSIAMLTAARNPEVKSMVLWAGAHDMSGYMADQYEDAQANGYTEMTFDWRGPLKLSIEWFDEVREINLLDELKNYQGAVLAIAGSLDDVVPPENAQQIVDACPGAVREALIIDGADHTFDIFTGDMAHFDELIEATVAWFGITL